MNETATASPPKPAARPDETEQRARRIDEVLRTLGTGPLAELRRMDPALPPAHFWWLLETTGGSDMAPERLRLWAEVVRILALFIPRGDPERRERPARRVPLGEALADGGAGEAWEPEYDGEGRPLPVFSEMRLTQLLVARDAQRRDALRRACAFIAPRLGGEVAVQPGDVARALLCPDQPEILARPYYRRLARAQQPKKDRPA